MLNVQSSIWSPDQLRTGSESGFRTATPQEAAVETAGAAAITLTVLAHVAEAHGDKGLETAEIVATLATTALVAVIGFWPSKQ
jgi:hypothetical protein